MQSEASSETSVPGAPAQSLRIIALPSGYRSHPNNRTALNTAQVDRCTAISSYITRHWKFFIRTYPKFAFTSNGSCAELSSRRAETSPRCQIVRVSASGWCENCFGGCRVAEIARARARTPERLTDTRSLTATALAELVRSAECGRFFADYGNAEMLRVPTPDRIASSIITAQENRRIADTCNKWVHEPSADNWITR